MSRSHNSQPVVIVGAGMAGLACAKTLAKAKIPFLLLEASDRPGGRIKTDYIDGFTLDHGFQVFLSGYTRTQTLLDVAALDFKPFYSGALVRSNHAFHRMSDPWQHPEDAVKTLSSPVGSIKDKYLIASLRASLRKLPPMDLPEEDTSTLTYLKKKGFSDEFIQQFFRPFFGGIFLEGDLATSKRMFEFTFHMFSKGPAVVPARGMAAIPQQIASSLPPNCIRYNAIVSEFHESGVFLNSGEEVPCSHIVLTSAAPFGSNNPLKPHPEVNTNWNAVSCFYFSAPNSPLHDPILVLNGDGRGPINNLCVLSDIAPSYAPENKALVSVSVLGLNTKDTLSEVVVQLEEWFGPQVKDWEHLKTYEIPYALPQFKPDQSQEISQLTYSNLTACGDYTEIPSIEGAVLSGQKAAQALIHQFQH